MRAYSLVYHFAVICRVYEEGLLLRETTLAQG